jgi:hypothetical protein
MTGEKHIQTMVKSYVSGFKDKNEALEYYREDPSIFESQLIDYIEKHISPVEDLIKSSF